MLCGVSRRGQIRCLAGRETGGGRRGGGDETCRLWYNDCMYEHCTARSAEGETPGAVMRSTVISPLAAICCTMEAGMVEVKLRPQ